MKIRLALHLLVIPHTIEETLRAILNLHEGSGTVLVHLKPIYAADNLVYCSLNRANVAGVECFILNESRMVRVCSLILVSCSVIGVERLADVILREHHIWGCQVRMFNLVIYGANLLRNICAVLGFEVFRIF